MSSRWRVTAAWKAAGLRKRDTSRAIKASACLRHGAVIGVEAHDVLAERGTVQRPEPALPLAYFVVSLEVIGGLLIVIGLFTRPVAALVAGHLACIAF